uniref:Acyltransferase n=1 Tax=Panagrolaimus sp. JU765 TaxID=591449 RepID=A0AC34RDE0_9BILA
MIASENLFYDKFFDETKSESEYFPNEINIGCNFREFWQNTDRLNYVARKVSPPKIHKFSRKSKRKMKWAPLAVPLERRLQTGAVCYFVFIFILAPGITLFLPLYLLFFTSYWWLMALYLGWMVYDWKAPETGSHPSDWMKKGKVWEYFASYFPIKLVKTAELSPNHNYIIGCHPHGILGISTFANLGTDATGWSKTFEGIFPRLCTLPSQFYFPFRRDLATASGIISSSANSIDHVLNSKEKGQAVGIILGGAEEALDSHPDNFDLKLSSRKGFIKIALKNGAHLVPMYNFGENCTYHQVENQRGTKLRNFQSKFKQYCGFSPPFFMGRGIFNYSFGLLPYRTPIFSVVGKPIPVKKNLNPTQEEIDQLHAEYCANLTQLFEENKTKYGISPDAKLNIY